jgi:hypothetical protein
MIKYERDKEVADITLATALKITENSVELSKLIELRKGIPWYRFARRGRIKKQIAAKSAMNIIMAVMGSAEIYRVMSTRIPNYPFGMLTQKTES